MEHVLSLLYGASGIAASALYIPQILKYRRDPAARHSIALLSWSGWIAVAAVTILYAIFVANNWLIAAVAGINLLAQATVLAYGLCARFGNKPAASGIPMAPVPPEA